MIRKGEKNAQTYFIDHAGQDHECGRYRKQDDKGLSKVSSDNP
jgi:hypothetical protein